MDDIRKRVGIARRKTEMLSSIQQSQRPLDEPSPSKRQKTDPTPEHDLNQQGMTQTQNGSPDNEREDIEVIVNFFASGGGDDSDDDLVWRNLANHVSVPFDLSFSFRHLKFTASL
jgi:hypothetical protein